MTDRSAVLAALGLSLALHGAAATVLWSTRLPLGRRTSPLPSAPLVVDLVEGVVDHHLLGLHHVKEFAVHPLAWDLGFLLLGAGLVVGGALLARRVDPGPPGRFPGPGSGPSRAGLVSGP